MAHFGSSDLLNNSQDSQINQRLNKTCKLFSHSAPDVCVAVSDRVFCSFVVESRRSRGGSPRGSPRKSRSPQKRAEFRAANERSQELAVEAQEVSDPEYSIQQNAQLDERRLNESPRSLRSENGAEILKKRLGRELDDLMAQHR